MQARNLSTFPVTAEIAEEAARIRAGYNLSTPDSIQLATATRHDATFLLTNDKALAKMTEVSVITLAEVASGK